ncbi:MAG: ParB/RepB/Spo0J family partition protein [Clostridiales bacterium]|nr:ParB/RepB/Spo0J family partition protein [Clostridiales bacterium]
MSAMKKSRGLGRGLDALFENVELAPPAAEELQEPKASEDNALYLNINDIKPNSKQPRKTFKEESIQELAESILAHGVLQPILVRKADQGYELVAGERRWRAARAAGLKEVPCLLRELTEEQNVLVALIENVQREDLNSIEEAEAIQEMVTSFGMSQADAAKSLGKSRPYVTNALRLLKLPAKVRDMVVDGTLSGGHARALAAISDEELLMEGVRRAISQNWSVREMEAYAAQVNGEKKAAPKGKKKQKKAAAVNQELQVAEEELREALGTKVRICHGKKGGSIVIDYYSKEELDRLLDILRR